MICIIKERINEKVELEFLNASDALDAYSAYYKMLNSQEFKDLTLIPLGRSLHCFFKDSIQANSFCIRIAKAVKRIKMNNDQILAYSRIKELNKPFEDLDMTEV